MRKKVSVIGRGTAGALTVLILRSSLNPQDYDIEWNYDPGVPAQTVGEGSTLHLPALLYNKIDFKHSELKNINGTIKAGIYKEGWGLNNQPFYHDFQGSAVSYHFSATDLQEYIYSKVKNDVSIRERNVTVENIDSDYVIDCSGTPKDDNLVEDMGMFLNAAYVVQCPWSMPEFIHTLTIARPYGWAFGIPLQNRCSIGYMYNNTINTIEDIQGDISYIFEKFNLAPSEKINSFSFKNYRRKENFTERVTYNGNASFFLEPLEATSIATIINIALNACSIIRGDDTTSNNINHNVFLDEVKGMISLHYLANNNFSTAFWTYCQDKALNHVRNSIKTCPMFKEVIKNSTTDNSFSIRQEQTLVLQEAGTWNLPSYRTNIQGLGIKEILRTLI